MSNNFNPYQSWLGIDPSVSNPNFYQLLELEPFENSVEKISAAADRATARVRGFRPGSNAADWAKLLDEIDAARQTLTSATEKPQYDRRLRIDDDIMAELLGTPPQSGKPKQTPKRDASTAPNVAPNSAPVRDSAPVSPPPTVPTWNPPPVSAFYPPGMVPPASQAGAMHNPMAPMTYAPNYGASPAAPNPMAAYVPTAAPTTGPGYAPHPMQPMAANPMSPMTPMAQANYPGQAPAYPYAAAPAMQAMPTPAMNAGGYAPVAQIVQVPPGVQVPIAMGIPVAQNQATPNAQPLLNQAPAESMLRVRKSTSLPRRSSNPWQLPIILGVAGGILGAIAFILINSQIKPQRDDKQVAKQGMDAEKKGPGKTVPDASSGPRKNSPPSMASIPQPPPAESEKDAMSEKPRRSKKPKPTEAMPDSSSMKPDTAAMPKDPTLFPDKSDTAPETPKPEPSVPESTAPVPTPQPVVEPKPEEVKQLAEAMKTARSALAELNVPDAEKSLSKVEKLPMLPEQAEKFDRLQHLTSYTKQFVTAMREATKSMEAGGSLKIGNTEVGIVETFANKDEIILRVAGTNKKYFFRDMPPGLAMAIANEWLDKTAASSIIVRANYYMVSKKSNDDTKAKAKEWLNEAKGQLGDVVALLEKAYADTYDL